MRRGDIVTVTAIRGRGKRQRAVIVQTDALPLENASVVVCPLTSEVSDAPHFRVALAPSQKNGLRARSQIMADKPVTIRGERVGRKIGYLNDRDMTRLNVALAFVMGFAD